MVPNLQPDLITWQVRVYYISTITQEKNIQSIENSGFKLNS